MCHFPDEVVEGVFLHSVLFLNGPNLNLLGQREPEVYGQLSLSDLNDLMADKASRLGLVVTTYQSNIESANLHKNITLPQKRSSAYGLNKHFRKELS